MKNSNKQPCLTEFEWQVLRAAFSIPLGETRSYHWIAKKIGRPKAVRAVGHALGKNPFAPIVPCHRVLRSDGSLGGYAGGLAKKKQLLEMERHVREHFRAHRRRKSSK